MRALELVRIDERPFEVLGERFTPIPLLHGRFNVFGFRIGNVAYCTDVSGIPERAWPLLEGLDVFVIDALRPDKPHPSHFDVGQALEAINRVKPRRAYFTHMAHTMEYDARMQTLRGNNVPFSHAVAQHEMIPGHNLVGYMGQRFAGYRARIGGSTPFFGEGWPLYWELTLYEKGFHDTPEERVGALFWRMHRCARIIFSLNFHMGKWSPQESIDFLVEKVGHERDNATAEVRRSFQGGGRAF